MGNRPSKIDPDLPDYATCLVCSKELTAVNTTHLKLHGMTTQDYRAKFPSALFRGGLILRKFAESKRTGYSRYSHLPLGEYPDDVIAERFNVAPWTVSKIRRTKAIPRFSGVAMSQEGKPLRSVLEAKYDAYLHWKGIAHVHEPPLATLPQIPDFDVEGIGYVEIAGMEGFPKYETKIAVKKEIYSKSNIRARWLTPKEVNELYKECPVPLKLVQKSCQTCGKLSSKIGVSGLCYKCYRKHRADTVYPKINCLACGAEYSARPESRMKYCSRTCAGQGLKKFAIPPEVIASIDGSSATHNASAAAKRLGINPISFLVRLRRMGFKPREMRPTK